MFDCRDNRLSNTNTLIEQHDHVDEHAQQASETCGCTR